MRVARKAAVISWATVLVVVVLIAGWSLGDLLANQFRGFTRERERSRMQDGILEQMGTIKVGDLLKQGEFLDLNGRIRKLPSDEQPPFLITFIRSDCGVCKDEVKRVDSLMLGAGARDHHPYLSNGIAYDFTESQEFSSVLESVWLDNNGTYFDQYGMYVTPLNLLIGRDYRVSEIYVGLPPREKLKEWYKLIGSSVSLK